ncbi:hypothetical protein F2P56_035152 [Juglans regia]|uniref:Reverse transcriptase domain-containing protein n=1 Tax=Juglans regia TaxID=51240 RepID=A0A833T954_JUGRE|nr:hypothetical protein F2P56_035152 [Juglans regia]
MAEVAEVAQHSESPKTEIKDLAHDIESQIKGAMRSRVAYFQEQADSLTFEGVRRLLEKDLGLETYALDVHKRLIKQYLLEVFLDFHSLKKFNKCLNAMLIALILKKHAAMEVEDFRSISLVSGVYKIISKVLVNRLSLVIEQIISKSHNAFV